MGETRADKTECYRRVIGYEEKSLQTINEMWNIAISNSYFHKNYSHWDLETEMEKFISWK